ncbi:MAG: GDP-mannose 4,6-dehydratase [Candidatus Heimdallarchaeota archaeon]|nr:GDP-mannose 4,6-dehydratase [Candidatus Heimdallarchaeota archaeon]
MTNTNKFWLLKNTLVTGASGFLGSYVVEELIKKQANVIAIVRDHVPKSRLFHEKINQNITTTRGDIRDYFFVKRILNEYEINSVFHLAAQTIVPIANRSPISTFESNIKGTWNILEACRDSELVNEIIVASSDKAYGSKDQLPYYETDPLNAKHPYDLSKTFTDLLAQSYFETYGLATGITRCGNLYGGGDLNFNRIVPQTIRSILYDQNPEIRSDGTFTRDYFYVEDAANSYITLAEQLLSKKLQGEAFNFGTGNQVSVLDLVNKMIKISKKSNLKPEIKNTAKGEIKDQYLSCEKAEKTLNWKPSHSLEEGLSKSYQWYKRWFHK